MKQGKNVEKMKSIWMNLSENQQDWIYTVISIFILILSFGWLVVFYDSSTYVHLLSLLFSPFSGYFFFKGKGKRYRSQWIKPNRGKTKENLSSITDVQEEIVSKNK